LLCTLIILWKFAQYELCCIVIVLHFLLCHSTNFPFHKTLMNARLAHITVMLMPTAPTPKDHSIVPVIRVTREMESRVLVSNLLKGFPRTCQNILDYNSVIVFGRMVINKLRIPDSPFYFE